MHNAELYKYDLANRFPTYTWNETQNGDVYTFEAVDGSTVKSRGKGAALADAVMFVRDTLVGPCHILPFISEAQRDLLTGVSKGQMIYNTDAAGEVYNGADWDAL